MYSTTVKREDKAYGSVIFELPPEVEQLADRELMGQTGAILTLAEYPELAVLAPTQTYEGERWTAMRRRIDQLDQVTFGRIKAEKREPRRWAKKDLERLGVKFSSPLHRTIEIQLPCWKSSSVQVHRVSLINATFDPSINFAIPAKGSFRNGYDVLAEFPLERFGFKKYLKAIHSKSRLHWYRYDTYDEIVASVLDIARYMLMRAEKQKNHVTNVMMDKDGVGTITINGSVFYTYRHPEEWNEDKVNYDTVVAIVAAYDWNPSNKVLITAKTPKGLVRAIRNHEERLVK